MFHRVLCVFKPQASTEFVLLLWRYIMALDLRKLAVRSASAAVFVVLLVGSVLLGYLCFALFFFAVALLALHEFYKISEKLGASPFKVSGFIFGILIYIAGLNYENIVEGLFVPDLSFSILLVFPFVILSQAMFSKHEQSVRDGIFTIAGVFYVVVPFMLLNGWSVQLESHHAESNFEIRFAPALVLGVIFLIWSNDTFAYLGGSLFGKHKMIERVSPGKTWEGTAIGVLITFGLSFLFDDFIFHFQQNLWPVFGITVPILATIGDLVESKLKREAGVKDSGNIMPGHGGALDRFDSLIFVSPFISLIFYLSHILTE